MGAGRPPLPDAAKKLRGTFRKDRERTESPVPAIPERVPPPPMDVRLNDSETQEYYRTCELLLNMRILTIADLEMVANYVRTRTIYLDAQDDLRETGGTTMGEHGPKPNPNLSVVARLYPLLRDFWQRFGMNPSDRQKLIVQDRQEPEQEAEWDL